MVETASEEELASLVREEFRRLLRLRGEPVVVRVYRWRRANPQYEVGHLERVERFEGQLATHLPRVYLAGSPYRGVGIPDCIAQAQATAEKVLTALIS
jgi:oxygen-dependent protoporphyrinogen oxidase